MCVYPCSGYINYGYLNKCAIDTLLRACEISCSCFYYVFDHHSCLQIAPLCSYICMLGVAPLFSEGIVFLIQEILKSKQSAAPGSSTFLLSELDTRLRETLSEWFTPQLMELQHITWESPCDILEKVSDYEAVHRLRHWKDLKHRVGSNRRCFIFTHKAIPREPIVVLHVALTSEPSRSIQVIGKHIAGNVSHPLMHYRNFWTGHRRKTRILVMPFSIQYQLLRKVHLNL